MLGCSGSRAPCGIGGGCQAYLAAHLLSLSNPASSSCPSTGGEGLQVRAKASLVNILQAMLSLGPGKDQGTQSAIGPERLTDFPKVIQSPSHKAKFGLGRQTPVGPAGLCEEEGEAGERLFRGSWDPRKLLKSTIHAGPRARSPCPTGRDTHSLSVSHSTRLNPLVDGFLDFLLGGGGI